MCDNVFGYVVASLLTLTGVVARSYRNDVAYDIYEVEHEVSSLQVRNATLANDPDSVHVSPGCQQCTDSEIQYCLGSNFINDHCCCDKRYREVLPFIPHTCYIGTRLCKPIVDDCATYSRLRACCCEFFLLKKWSSKGSTVTTESPRAAILLFLLLHLYTIVQKCVHLLNYL